MEFNITRLFLASINDQRFSFWIIISVHCSYIRYHAYAIHYNGNHDCYAYQCHPYPNGKESLAIVVESKMIIYKTTKCLNLQMRIALHYTGIKLLFYVICYLSCLLKILITKYVILSKLCVACYKCKMIVYL